VQPQQSRGPPICSASAARVPMASRASPAMPLKTSLRMPASVVSLTSGGQAASALSITSLPEESEAGTPAVSGYARDMAAWLAWCAVCRITLGLARLAHVDLWIREQMNDGAGDSSIVRRISAVSSWYKYMIANTDDDPVPIATRNPTERFDKRRGNLDRAGSYVLATRYGQRGERS
jgi:hypothetical protein